MFTKRRVFMALLFLLAGAVVNVAVAWAFVYWSVGVVPYSDHPNLADPLYPSKLELIWLARHGPPDLEDCRWTVGEIRTFGITRRAHYLVPESQLGTSGPWFLVLYTPQVAIISAGWPFRSLQTTEIPAKRTPINRSEFQYRSAIVVDRALSFGGTGSNPRPLPLRPKVVAFLVNSMFYGALLWTIPFGPRAFRRWRRKKRNRCPACDYDLRGTDHAVCPECGK